MRTYPNEEPVGCRPDRNRCRAPGATTPPARPPVLPRLRGPPLPADAPPLPAPGARGSRLTGKLLYVDGVAAQQLGDIFGSAIAYSQPDNLGWRSAQNAEPMKVFILRDERTPSLLCQLPYRSVRRAACVEFPHMQRIRQHVLQHETQPLRQLFVKEETHHLQAAGIPVVRCSRSAAYAKHARMSSTVICGKSLSNWSSDMPPAKYPRTSPTEIRVPRMQGRPDLIIGSRLIRSSRVISPV